MSCCRYYVMRRMCRAERGRVVWTEAEHDRWHREAIMPHYREGAR